MLIEKVPGADEIDLNPLYNDLGMATANSCSSRRRSSQIECTINGLGERAGNTALEEVVMALKVRGDIMPYHTRIDATKLMNLSRKLQQFQVFQSNLIKQLLAKTHLPMKVAYTKTEC